MYFCRNGHLIKDISRLRYTDECYRCRQNKKRKDERDEATFVKYKRQEREKELS